MAALSLRPVLLAAALLCLLVSAQDPEAPPAGDGVDLGEWLQDHLGPGTGADADGDTAGVPAAEDGAAGSDDSSSDWSSDMSSSCSACVDPDTVVLPPGLFDPRGNNGTANITACVGQPRGTVVSQIIRVPVPGSNGTVTQAIRFNITCGVGGNPLENDESFSDSSASNSPGNDGGEDEAEAPLASPSPAPTVAVVAQPPIAAAASGAASPSVWMTATVTAAAAAGALMLVLRV